MHKSVTFNNNFHALTTMNMQYTFMSKINYKVHCPGQNCD